MVVCIAQEEAVKIIHNNNNKTIIQGGVDDDALDPNNPHESCLSIHHIITALRKNKLQEALSLDAGTALALLGELTRDNFPVCIHTHDHARENFYLVVS